MNDHNIVLLLGFATSMICFITPIVKLNSTITRLNVILDEFKEEMREKRENLSERTRVHGLEIDEVKEKVSVLETKVKLYHGDKE